MLQLSHSNVVKQKLQRDSGCPRDLMLCLVDQSDATERCGHSGFPKHMVPSHARIHCERVCGGNSQSLITDPQKMSIRKEEEESVRTQHVFTLPFSSSPKTSSVFHVFTFLAIPSHFLPPGLRLSVGASRLQTHGCPLKQDNPRPYSALPLNYQQ